MMDDNEYRLIPAGIKVWLISLQEHVRFEKDLPVRITNRIIGTDKYVYGKLQLLLFNTPTGIPGVTDKLHGDVGFTLSDTTNWTIPEPQIFKTIYNYTS